MTHRYLRFLAILAALASLGVPRAAPAQDVKPVIAVLPLADGGSHGQTPEDFDALRRGIAAMLASELSRNPAVSLVPRDQLRRTLDEQGLGAASHFDQQTAARVGQAHRAHYVVAATFIDLYGDFRVDARIIDAATGEVAKVVRSDPKLGDRRQMFRIIQSVAERITDGAGLPPLPTAAAQAARARNIPTDALTYFSRALVYHDRGDTRRAIEFYNKALSAYPDYAEAKEGLRRLET
jgi:TolB-like protein